MAHHSETMIYGYATALLGHSHRPENVAALRAKCLANGETPGSIELVETHPGAFIKGGWPAVTAQAQGWRKSKGRADYEADCIAKPLYHDGAARCHWDALCYAVQDNWERHA